MHVLITADTIGGVWTYARELVAGLARRGVRVTLVSFGEIPTPKQTEWMEGLRGFDYHPTAFRLEWMQDAREDLEASAEYLREIISETRPDVLHLNQYCYGNLNADIPTVIAAHSDVISWWVAVHGHEPPESEWISCYREVVSAGLLGATALVAPSRWMLEQIESHFAIPAQASVIYNGRNPGLFNPHTTKEELVVSVGRLWDGGKNVSLLTQRSHKLPISIAGPEEHPDEALRSDEGGHACGIQYEGNLGEGSLRSLYARASIYAGTSRYEPFGLAPLEAALSRCALVLNDVPSFREVWGETALYFRKNDAEDLATSIDRLRTDRDLRVRYSNLAYQRARSRYNAERMVEEYLNLYRAVVPAGAAAV